MPVSPYRYYQLARYFVQRWLDHAPPLAASWKGKGRAAPVLQGAAAFGGGGILRAGLEERRTWNDMVPALAGGAGSAPSTSASTSRDARLDSNSNSNANSSTKVHTPSRRTPYTPRALRPDPNLPGPNQQEIYRLMNDARLGDPGAAKAPREVVVLCHGLYGFSTATPIPLFPSLKLHYWASVLEVLRDKMGANVLVVGVKGTGSVKERAEQMHAFLKEKLPRGAGVNFVAHSMGGLDCRYLISTIQPTSYKPLSLTTIGTPHRGSPFMDWCAANIGVGSAATVAAAAAMSSSTVAKALPYSLKAPLLSRAQEQGKKEGISAFTTALTSYLLNIFDSPAYSNLTTGFLRDTFNPETPDMAGVQYTSVAGRVAKMSVLHPLWFPKLVLDSAAENGYSADGSAPGKEYEGNDGLVSVASARWGNFLGTVDDCHHWDLRGEGGLFPNISAVADTDKKKREDNDQGRKIKGDADEHTPSSSGAWDWQGDFGNGVSEHLGLAAEAAKSTIDRVKVAAGEGVGKVSAAGTSVAAQAAQATNAVSNAASSRRPDNWDLQQVGQVLDWVGDLLPGDGKETKERKMADAVREKEKAHYKRDQEAREEAGMKQEEREERKLQADRKKREKFDLARFYGGLMLKLRDDGL